jgi:imidazolonepropionase
MSKHDQLWVNVNLASFTAGQPNYGAIKNAALAVTDTKISWLGPQSNLPTSPEDFAHSVYDAKGAWITPGLIDCHTHLVYGGQRAQEFAWRLAGDTYTSIAERGGGILSTVEATRAASYQELLASSSQRLKALCSEGVTTVEIKSGYGLDLENERKMLQVARELATLYPVTIKTTFLGAHTLPAEFKNRADDYIDYLCTVVLPSLAAEKLVDAVDAFCENIAVSVSQVKRIFEVAKSLKIPVKLHAEQLSNNGGALLAARYQALSADHLEHANEESIAAMAENNVTAVLLPGAYYYLRETQTPPVSLLRKYKVPLAISTDANPGTSPITSILAIANMACLLFDLSPEEALAGITRNAAKALGIEKDYGSLELGKIADFVLWNIQDPVELVYRLGLNPSVQIIKNGKIFSQ